jgi:hypothetical protein
MASGEMDGDLGPLLLTMGEEMARATPGASGMLRAMQARFLDLYGRLEGAESAELMTHTRGVSQLEALYRSIRLASDREGARKLRGLPSAPVRESRPLRGGLPLASSTPNEAGGDSQGVEADEAAARGEDDGRKADTSGDGAAMEEA